MKAMQSPSCCLPPALFPRSLRSFGSILCIFCSLAFCGEAIYLQSGEEYFGDVLSIARGELHARIGGKAQAFPLSGVQRIEFQRARLLDEARSAADLPTAIPFFAEAIGPKTDDLRRRFPQAGFVVLADETVVTINTSGAWEAKRFEAWRILEDRGAESAMRSLNWFPDRQRVEVIFGLTVTPDGSVLHLADTAMKDEALHARLPAYNFQHRLRFNLKGAVPGATLILATTHRGRATILQPFVLDRVFWDDEPALRRSVRLAVEEGAKRLVATATANGPKDWGRDGLWEIKDAPQLFREPMMPPLQSFAPRLVIAFPKAEWPELARAFLERAGGAASLPTRGVPPRALFDQVRQAIRLERIPLEALPDGPAPPATTLGRRYGTAAERALLLAALLRGAGHKADVVLARPRDAGPLLATAPRVHGLTAAVVRLTSSSQTQTWLQTDDEDRGFGELDPGVQGGEGLDLASGQLVAIPILPPEAEASIRTVEVTIEPDGAAVVHESQKLRGHFATDARGLKDLTDDQRKKWAARYVGGDATGVDLLEFTHSDLNNANAEERLSFRYRVPALAERAGGFLILRLPNARLPAADVGRSTRERDLFWQGTEHQETAFTIKAPPGYAVYATGQQLDKKGDGWSLVAGFAPDSADKRLVRFQELWQRSALAAHRDSYARYRDARIARSRLREQVIVFVKE